MPLYHVPNRRILQDVVTFIREHSTLANAGRILNKSAERHLKSSKQMCWLFRDYPEAIHETSRLFSELKFSLDEFSYEYSEETISQNATPQAELE